VELPSKETSVGLETIPDKANDAPMPVHYLEDDMFGKSVESTFNTNGPSTCQDALLASARYGIHLESRDTNSSSIRHAGGVPLSSADLEPARNTTSHHTDAQLSPASGPNHGNHISSSASQVNGEPIPVLHATLVQDPPLYDAEYVPPQSEQAPPPLNTGQIQPWWKHYSRQTFALLLLIVGAITAIIAVMSSKDDSPNDGITAFPPNDPVSTPTEKPSPDPSILKQTTAPSTTHLIMPTNAPSPDDCASFIQNLCNKCYPHVALDGDTAVFTSSSNYVTIATHVDGHFDRIGWSGDLWLHVDSVAISGNITAVGYPHVTGGRVDMYERDSAGSWGRSDSYIKPDDTRNNIFASRFGISVAIEGNNMVVGAKDHWTDQNMAGWAGAAYIYLRRTENDWVQGSKLSTGGTWRFGTSVAIKKNIVAVGDPKYGRKVLDSGGENEKGRVFVYTYNTTSGKKLSEFPIHTNSHCKKWFGHSVELTDNGLFVGCPDDDKPDNPGVVFFYQQSDNDEGEFILPQKIEPSNGEAADRFGWSLAEYGNIAVIGTNKKIKGKVYIFARVNSAWVEVAIIDAPEGSEYFGKRVALSGKTLLIASSQDAYSYSLDGCSK